MKTMTRIEQPVLETQDPVFHCQVCCKEIPRALARQVHFDDGYQAQWLFCGPQCLAIWEQGLLED